MKKIRRAEFLAVVAIVASATAMQIREHSQAQDQAQDAVPATEQAPMTSCGPSHDGFVPAGCEPTRDDPPAERATRAPHAAPQIWV